MAVQPDGALADVSEAYGAKGIAPDGFTSQGVSISFLIQKMETNSGNLAIINLLSCHIYPRFL